VLEVTVAESVSATVARTRKLEQARSQTTPIVAAKRLMGH